MNNFTEAQVAEIIRLYDVEKLGQSACSKKVLGVNRPDLVKKILKEKGIHIRTQEEALAAQDRVTEKGKDKFYFEYPSDEMAWVMGLIASIGTISKKRNTIKIGVNADLPHSLSVLSAVKDYLGLEDEIEEYITHEGTSVISLTWTCAEHKKDLASYGITAEKHTNIRPPYELEGKYWNGYISGFLNGSELFFPEYPGAIVSFSEYLLSELQDFLKEQEIDTVIESVEKGGRKGEKIFVLSFL